MGNESFKTKILKAYNQEEERIYDSLQTTVILISKCNILMVMGDMNAKVGANRNGTEKEIGPNEIRDNGELLADSVQIKFWF